MDLSLKQGQQYGAAHSGQHGGAMAYGPYPGAVQEASVLPADLVASAHLLPLNQAFDYIRQFGPDADLKGGGVGYMSNTNKATQKKCQNSYKNYKNAVGNSFTANRLVAKHPECGPYVSNLTRYDSNNNLAAMGGGRRRGSRKTRKGRKASRKASRKGRKGSRKQRGGVLVRWGGGRRMAGGAASEMRYPMPVGEEGKMLIPAGLQAQAGLNPEWKLAENPMSFAPIATKFD